MTEPLITARGGRAGCCSHCTCVFTAISLPGHLFCLLMGILCQGKRWDWSGGGGAQLGTWKELVSQVGELGGQRGDPGPRKAQLSCRKEGSSRGCARRDQGWSPL